jgi:hypothetical protein
MQGIEGREGSSTGHIILWDWLAGLLLHVADPARRFKNVLSPEHVVRVGC